MLSGIFFFLNTVMFVVLIAALFKFMKFTEELSPRVKAIEAQIQDLIVRVQAVATQVEEVAANVRETVATVGGKARGLVGSAETLAGATSKQIEKFSPLITGVMTAIRVIRAVADYRDARKEKKSRKREAPKSNPRRKRFFLGK